MADLLQFTRDKPLSQLMLRYTLSSDLAYSDFADIIEEAIDLIADQLSANSQHHQNRSEDDLSVDLVDRLSAAGFTASHDTMHGGHCDIVVSYRTKFHWLGEAKLHSAYDWLLKGYRQLTSRYSSGLATSSRGGMVIYSYGARIDKMMDTWRARLQAAEPAVAVCDDGKRPAAFRSTAVHNKTGVSYGVRHIAICLNFDPQDRA